MQQCIAPGANGVPRLALRSPRDLMVWTSVRRWLLVSARACIESTCPAFAWSDSARHGARVQDEAASKTHAEIVHGLEGMLAVLGLVELLVVALILLDAVAVLRLGNYTFTLVCEMGVCLGVYFTLLMWSGATISSFQAADLAALADLKVRRMLGGESVSGTQFACAVCSYRRTCSLRQHSTLSTGSTAPDRRHRTRCLR